MRYDEREFDVTYDSGQITPEELLAAVREHGNESGGSFVPTLGHKEAGPAPPPLTPEELAQIDQEVISHGDAVDVEAHLVPGKFTVIDYYADWCGPCIALGKEMERMALEREDVAIRKVDVIDWESEAAKQATELYALPGLPYVRVYGPDGEFLGSVDTCDVGAVRALLKTP